MSTTLYALNYYCYVITGISTSICILQNQLEVLLQNILLWTCGTLACSSLTPMKKLPEDRKTVGQAEPYP